MFPKAHYLNIFGLEPRPFSELPNKMSFDICELEDDMKNFCQLVFSPDPITGNPSSDVAYMLSGADEGFKSYIKERLMKAVPQGNLADSADDALSLVKRNIVTPNQFQEYVTDYVKNMFSSND